MPTRSGSSDESFVVQQMTSPSPPGILMLCLVGDDPVVEAAVWASCPPPHRLQTFSREDLVNAQNALSQHGHAIVQAATEADAVLIDWAFDEAPAINTLCYHVRRDVTTPVFILCRGWQDSMAACVAAGADDALAFPIYLPYLQAKILSYRRLVDAVQRASRSSADAPVPSQQEVQQVGALRIDRTAHRFFIRNTELDLTPREFALIDFLMAHAGTLCTRHTILDHVWGINFDTGTNMVDVYMYFLRKKLEAYDLKDMIQTVRGHGYRLVNPDAERVEEKREQE